LGGCGLARVDVDGSEEGGHLPQGPRLLVSDFVPDIRSAMTGSPRKRSLSSVVEKALALLRDHVRNIELIGSVRP
jgi:hypothetical protein